MFSALEQLDCKNNALTELNVSENKQLKYLHCAFNRISSLDVSGLDKLISLNCENNNMSSLDLTGCTSLEIIYCRSNNLPRVDFSTNTKLKFIETFDNRLTKVDLSMLHDLEFVHLDHNLLTHLDLSGNTNLSPIGSGFVARNNQMETLTLPVSSTLVVEDSVYAEQDPKKGYERTEWYLDQEFTQRVPTELVANGQTLYVKWLPNDYTINFASNGGSGAMSSQQAVWDTAVTLPDNAFSRLGYQFVGWENKYGDGKVYNAQQVVTNLGGDIQGDRVTLYAKWQPIEYIVQFDPGDGSGKMDSVKATYDQTVKLSECTLTPPDPDKVFAGWSLTSDGNVRYKDGAEIRNLTTQAGQVVTLYAVWREKTNKVYLNKLDEAFASYTPDHYTEQDWSELTKRYADARQEMVDADESALEEMFSVAVSSMNELPTRQSRAEQVAGLWRDAYASVISQIDGQAIREENATFVIQEAEQAAAGLTADFVAEKTDLTDPADQQMILTLALQLTETTMQDLRRLVQAAEWADSLDGLSSRPLSDVTTASLSTYETAVAQAKDYTMQLDRSLMDALQQRMEIARQKQQAIAELHMDYSSHDPSQYDEDGIRQLDSILETAVLAIEQADSTSAISQLLTKAQQDLQAVPDKNGQTTPGGGDGDTDQPGGGGGAAGGGGGGAIGGGGAGSIPEGGTGSTVDLPVTGSVDSTGKEYTVQVSDEQLSKSVQTALNASQTAGTAPVVRVKVQADAVNTVNLTMSAASLAQLGEHKQAAFEMATPIGSIMLDAPALAAAVRWAGTRRMILILSKQDQASTTRSAVQSLWTWKLLCEGEELTDLDGGKAEIQLPFAVSAQQDTSCVAAYAQNTAGDWSELRSMYDAQNQSIRLWSEQPGALMVRYDETLAWKCSFTDVDVNAWYYPAVRYVGYHGIMSGHTEERFEPEGELSRAQLAQILYNMEGRPQAEKPNYVDVAATAWYADAIGWAVQAGILSGYGNGRMGPDDPVTREQLSAMLYRYADGKGYDVAAQAELSGFADAAHISDYARVPMSWAYAWGIVNGTSESTLTPDGSAERAQAAAMLMRFCEHV